ncbi:MAG: terpene cyclase/mutase family protein [Planctomycetales bacterium]|nr:terpene cyclase/mutase family protein [Planctomycetales bacterium]
MQSRFVVCVALLCGIVLGDVRVGQAQTESEVLQARQRGIEFLKSKQVRDGNWEFTGHEVGITALCTIALIENGVPLTDPVVQKGYLYVQKNYSGQKNTYDLALSVVLLSRLGDRRDKPRIRAMAARLVAGQLESGGWTYTCPAVESDVLDDPAKLPKPKEGFGDNSCTQFAVLGLWVASRTGVRIDRTLENVAKRFTTTQTDDGGWAYTYEAAAAAGETKSAAKNPSGPSMTGAGLFCLAVAQATQIRDALKKQKTAGAAGGSIPGQSLLENRVFEKGLKRTGDFVVGIAPGTPRYFLWSVERVGVLLGLDQMNNTDWFKKGSDSLLKTQLDTGGWPSAWVDTDKDGLSDTSFALLFLRKANLGSDISRLLEGEPEQKFAIASRTPIARFASLEEAVAGAKPGEVIRIDGEGPYKIGQLDLKQDVTIQAGFGVSPILTFEIGKDRLGIRKKPERDAAARNMINVHSGKVTFEGVRFQMDPPILKPPVPWGGLVVKGGSLRLLNCSFSESNKQGTAAVVVEAPGQLVVRNSLLVGGRAAIELVGNGQQEVVVDNSILFSNAGFVVTNDAKTKAPANVTININNSIIQTKDVVSAPKLIGAINVACYRSALQVDWIGANFLAVATGAKDRSWKGNANIYDVKQWIGFNGTVNTTVKDAASWNTFWGGTDKGSHKRLVPYAGGVARQMGNFSHVCVAQEWQLEIPSDAPQELQRGIIGINSYLAGPGSTFDQYRDTISYTDWQQGRLGITELDGGVGKAAAAAK